MAVAAKWHRHRKKCAHCGVIFPCWERTQRHCSRRCAGFSRGIANAESGRIGGARKAEASVARHMAAILAAWPAMPAEAREVIHRFGLLRYRAGRKSGERAGRRLGWAESLGERERAS